MFIFLITWHRSLIHRISISKFSIFGCTSTTRDHCRHNSQSRRITFFYAHHIKILSFIPTDLFLCFSNLIFLNLILVAFSTFAFLFFIITIRVRFIIVNTIRLFSIFKTPFTSIRCTLYNKKFVCFFNPFPPSFFLEITFSTFTSFCYWIKLYIFPFISSHWTVTNFIFLKTSFNRIKYIKWGKLWFINTTLTIREFMRSSLFSSTLFTFCLAKTGKSQIRLPFTDLFSIFTILLTKST